MLRHSATTPRAGWALACVLTIATALLVVLPIWLLVEGAQRHEHERQRIAVERQHLRDESRRVEEERQRLIETQRRIAWEEAARQTELQRQREQAERLRRIEAEEERRQADERAVEQRAEELRRLAAERQAVIREKQQRLERARAALEEGLTLAAHREDRAALTALSEALMLDANLNRGWSIRAAVRRRLGDIPGALTDFQEAVRREPDNGSCWFQCGELHNERQEYRQAIEAFTVVLKLEPDNVEAYRQRGLCHGGNGDVAKALADQTKAIDLAPNDPWAYYYRAKLQRRRDNLDRAFDDYTAAIDRDRANSRGLAGAYRGRGMLSLHWHKYEQALRDLTKALELDPTDTDAKRARTIAHLRKGDWNEALLDAEGLIENNVNDSAVYKLRGQAYMGLREYRRAHQDLTRALRTGRDAETYYLRARVKVHLGDFKEAIFDCNDATAIDPHLASAFYLRARLYLHVGSHPSRMATRRVAQEQDPTLPLP